MKIYDKGPWEVVVANVHGSAKLDGSGPTTDIRIDSDDFTHGASLIVCGDFKNDKEKIKYAKFICNLLNSAIQKHEFMKDMANK